MALLKVLEKWPRFLNVCGEHLCVGECPWRTCVRKDQRGIFFFFLISSVHILEIRKILENVGFLFLLRPATSGSLLMVCLGAHGLQGRKKKVLRMCKIFK